MQDHSETTFKVQQFAKFVPIFSKVLLTPIFLIIYQTKDFSSLSYLNEILLINLSNIKFEY
jgi:hypothetical protein